MVDVDRRLNLASQGIGRLRRVFSSRHLPTRLKFKILKSFIQPIASYGRETWRLTKEQCSKLDTWWMKKLRYVCGVTKHDHLYSVDILNYLGAEKFSHRARRLRLRYLGHVVRYPDERIVKQALSYVRPRQLKGRGANWMKQAKKDMDKCGLDLDYCHDREYWSEVVE